MTNVSYKRIALQRKSSHFGLALISRRAYGCVHFLDDGVYKINRPHVSRTIPCLVFLLINLHITSLIRLRIRILYKKNPPKYFFHTTLYKLFLESSAILVMALKSFFLRL